MTEHEPPNVLGVTLRFLCGTILGMMLGVWATMTTERPEVLAAGAAIGAGVAGTLSARYGVRFWEWVRHLRWFVP